MNPTWRKLRYLLRNNNFERNRCLGLASSLSIEVEGRDDTLNIATLSGHQQFTSYAKPIVDYNLGFRACYIVVKSVLGSRSNPQLNLALKQSLAYHENLLREAELTLSQKIVEMANAVKILRSERIDKPGIVPKLKNGLLNLRIWIKDLRLNSKYKEYTKRATLMMSLTIAKKLLTVLFNPHLEWYVFPNPKLDLGVSSVEGNL